MLALSAVSLCAMAEEKKDDKKKEAPRIACVAPLAFVPGQTQTVRIRGLSLADASAVKLANADVSITIKSKGKSEPPKPFDAAKVGDTEVVAEVKVPSDLKPADTFLVITTPAGDTPEFAIRIADAS
ncbi:MAG TPA: hypothetical protein VH475_14730, partial [Tepidisphaeraceae bacterium]